MVDGSLIRLFEADTTSKLAFRLDDGTRQLIVTFPLIRFTDAPAVAAGNDQTVKVDAKWAAEPDADGIAIQLDRF
jgi:hypothetical protein